jgi:hypothetical protein
VFDIPANANWLTIVHSDPSQGVFYRYAEFNVESEGWITTPGAIQGLTVLPTHLEFGSTAIGLSTGANAVGTEDAWYFATNQSGTNTRGPGPLEVGGFTRDFATYRIETVSVPEPSTLVLAGLSSVGAWLFCRKRSRA